MFGYIFETVAAADFTPIRAFNILAFLEGQRPSDLQPCKNDDLIIGNEHMGVSLNGGTPKSSILIGFSTINHQFWDTPIFGNTHIP